MKHLMATLALTVTLNAGTVCALAQSAATTPDEVRLLLRSAAPAGSSALLPEEERDLRRHLAELYEQQDRPAEAFLAYEALAREAPDDPFVADGSADAAMSRALDRLRQVDDLRPAGGDFLAAFVSPI